MFRFILIIIFFICNKCTELIPKFKKFNNITFLDPVNNDKNYNRNEIFNNINCSKLNLPKYVKNQFDLEKYVHTFLKYDLKYFSLSSIDNILKNKKGACIDYSILFYHGFKCLQQQNLINKKDNIYFVGGFFSPQYFDIKQLKASHAWNMVISNNLIYFYDATNNGTFAGIDNLNNQFFIDHIYFILFF